MHGFSLHTGKTAFRSRPWARGCYPPPPPRPGRDSSCGQASWACHFLPRGALSVTNKLGLWPGLVPGVLPPALTERPNQFLGASPLLVLVRSPCPPTHKPPKALPSPAQAGSVPPPSRSPISTHAPVCTHAPPLCAFVRPTYICRCRVRRREAGTRRGDHAWLREGGVATGRRRGLAARPAGDLQTGWGRARRGRVRGDAGGGWGWGAWRRRRRGCPLPATWGSGRDRGWRT